MVENGSIADALAILLDQPDMLPRWARLQWWLRYLVRHAQQFNPPLRSKDNVARHYDLDGRLYSLFLDADKQYSCAYFETMDATLDDAQLAKKRHLAAKLLIGAATRARHRLGLGRAWTVSGGNGRRQRYRGHAVARTIAVIERPRRREGPDAMAKFLLQDYRNVHGPFDRIVSVGMFEHVGVDFYEKYFRRCADCLPTTA